MIRIATIGTSMITGMLADAVAAVEGIRLETVYSRDAARAAATAAELGALGSTDDLEALLASDDIDAIYVGSPNSAHGDQVRQALDAGKHVLVEKPAVTSAPEWADLVAQSRAAGVVLLEGMRTEYDPGTALVRSLLPELGPLRAASFFYASRSSRYDKVLAGERVNMFDPEMAGGALRDLGVYGLHAMVTLLGTPDRVSAATVPLASGVDGAGIVVAQYPGMAVSVQYSKISTTQLPSEIQGEEGTLVIDHIASPRSVRLVRRDGTSTLHELDAAQHTLIGEVERFVELIETGADAAGDHARTAETLRIIDEVRLQTL